MQTGRQLRSLFATILLHCNPVEPHHLWLETKENLCDDLRHYLIRRQGILEPTEEQIYDYGLY
ncbi:hypothetical protein PAXINDRAFT_30314, partial [Paxillus involutus ATCC 200175]